MIHVDVDSFFVIVLVSALAAVTVALLPARLAPPVVVVELFLGILVGPQVLHLAKTDEFVQFFSNLGLGMLFFFAGYEIDFERIRGKPLELGAAGWLLSVLLAFGIGGVLAALGVIDTFLYVGAAMATTAIGTLIPILRDGGELRTRFGTYLLAAGGAAEFGPVLLVALFLSPTTRPTRRRSSSPSSRWRSASLSPRCGWPGAAGTPSSAPSRPAASWRCGSRSSSSSVSSCWRARSGSTSCSAASSPG